MPKYLVALDTETGGLFPGKHPMLELACIVADAKTGEHLEVFHALVGYEKLPPSTAYALRMNRYLERINDPNTLARVISARDLARDFFTWFNRVTQEEYKDYVFLGHNPDFDLDFVNAFMFKNLDLSGWSSLIPRDKVRDTRQMVAFMIDSGFFPGLRTPKFEVVMDYLGNKLFPKGDVRGQVHDANWDAAMTVELYRYTTRLIRDGLFSNAKT